MISMFYALLILTALGLGTMAFCETIVVIMGKIFDREELTDHVTINKFS